LRNPDLDSGGILSSNAAPLISGGLSISNNGQKIVVDGVYLDDDGNGQDDDFALYFPLSSVVAGEAYSFSGTATFSLAELGDPDIGSQATFDDLEIGAFTALPSAGIDAGQITLSVFTAVPEPSSLITSLFCLTMALGRRTRKRHQ